MDLDLERAFEEPIDLSHSFDVPVARLDRPELVSLGPVKFTGRLEKAETGFLLEGRLDFSGAVSCARCLNEVPFKRSAPVSWVFAPVHERPTQEEKELQAEDLDVVWYDDLLVPFDPLIDEQLQLELPMKALCRDDCKGLCPRCGVDRNAGTCTCTEPEDDRWTPLKSLISPR
jgi:uncharacterized protein